MRRTALILAAAVIGVAAIAVVVGLNQPVEPDTSPLGRVNTAYQAMGGERVDELNTVILRARLQHWDPGASFSLTQPEMPDLGISTLVQSRDLDRGLTHNEWDRPKADDGMRRTFSEVVTPEAGWAVGNNAVNGRTPKRAIMIDAKPAHTMSSRRLTATLRELDRLYIVQAMRANPDRLTEIEDQTVDGVTYPSIQYSSPYGLFVVLFDPETNLPERVRSPEWDALEGNSVYEAEFMDWRDVGGTQMPFLVRYTLNGKRTTDLTVLEAEANPQLPANLFDIPAEQLAMAPRPADPGITPFQWIIRRQVSGFYFDSDNMYGDDDGTITLLDIAPNVSITQGSTHNTVFIATENYLIAVEAPNDDGQSIPSIALAKERYPGKPIRYLVLTHHHVDHVGGMRQYAAEGATIVVGPGNGDFFRQALARPQTQNWNAPQTQTTPEVIEVADMWRAPETRRQVGFYVVENPHSDGAMIGYINDARLGLVTDLWITGPPVSALNPQLASVVDAVQKWRLNPQRFSGGHGTVGDYAPLATLARAAQRAQPAAR